MGTYLFTNKENYLEYSAKEVKIFNWPLLLAAIVLVSIFFISPAMAGEYGTVIYPGETVFIGESGLDISNATGSETTISYYSCTGFPGVSAPSDVVTISDSSSFYVSSYLFEGQTGAWYKGNTNQVAFYVCKPSISLSLFNSETREEVTNKVAMENEKIAIRINSNLNAIFSRDSSGGNAGVDCYIETPDGATLTTVWNSTTSTSLSSIQPTNTLFWVPSGTRTGIWELNLNYYQAGIYKIYAVCNVNGMKDNLGTITGVTKSDIGTLSIFTYTDTPVSITADKETVVRSNYFTVTIEGDSGQYAVWISGTNNYSNTTNYPPTFLPDQDDIDLLTQAQANELFYKENVTVAQDVAYAADGITNEWAITATTGPAGSITIGLKTDENTKDAVYKIRVEKYISSTELSFKYYDTVEVKVEKGTVYISPDIAYLILGDSVEFSGYNTDTDNIYLFITGPGLPENGGFLSDPYSPVCPYPITGNNNYTFALVKTDDSWKYEWDTSGLSLDTGSYTIYAVSQMRNKSGLADVEYDTIDITVLDSTEESLLTLKPGWNFISIPKRLDSSGGNNTAGKLFQDVDSGGHSALMYNGSNSQWEAVKANTIIKPLDALWIYSNSTENKNIYFTFDSNPLQAPPSKHLSAGWNTLGYSSTEPATARDTLIDVSGKWTKVIGWDADAQNFEDTIINGGSGIYSSSRAMLPGKGYWIWMKEEGTIASLAINSEEV